MVRLLLIVRLVLCYTFFTQLLSSYRVGFPQRSQARRNPTARAAPRCSALLCPPTGDCTCFCRRVGVALCESVCVRVCVCLRSCQVLRGLYLSRRREPTNSKAAHKTEASGSKRPKEEEGARIESAFSKPALKCVCCYPSFLSLASSPSPWAAFTHCKRCVKFDFILDA